MSIGEAITLEDLERDPYPIYARLREEEPVSWVPAVGLWLVTGYDDVRHVDLKPEVSPAREGAHLAFAAGNHFCLGAWFGRHLARVSVDLLLERLPNLRLDPDRPPTLSGWEFRFPDSTWVRWDPVES